MQVVNSNWTSHTPWCAICIGLVCFLAFASRVAAQCTYVAVIEDTVVSSPPPGPNYYQVTLPAGGWRAIGARSPSDWDLEIYTSPSVFPACVSGWLVGSYAASGVDFVVSKEAGDTHYVKTSTAGGSADVELEWQRGEHIDTDGTPEIRTTGPDDVLTIWRPYLEEGTEYGFVLDVQSGSPELRALLFVSDGSVYWAPRSARIWEHGPGSWAFTPETTGRHGLVLVNENGAAGSYDLRIRTCEVVELTSGVMVPSASPGPNVYELDQSTPNWSAIGIRSSPGGPFAVNWDLEVHADTAPAPDCVGGLLVESSSDDVPVDFVIGDFRHNPTGTYYAKALLVDGVSVGRTEWDNSAAIMPTDGTPVVRSTGWSDVVTVWDVYLDEGLWYVFDWMSTAEVEDEPPDPSVSLFMSDDTTYWAPRAGAEWEETPPSPSPGTTWSYRAPKSDWYGLVVTNDNGRLGTYSLAVTGGFVVTPESAPPVSYRLRPAAPNPFRSATTIGFDLREEEETTVDVFDLLGRHVRSLVHERLPAGRHSVTWSGRDASGSSVTPGIYFVRLSSGAFTTSEKLLLIE